MSHQDFTEDLLNAILEQANHRIALDKQIKQKRTTPAGFVNTTRYQAEARQSHLDGLKRIAEMAKQRTEFPSMNSVETTESEDLPFINKSQTKTAF